MKHLQLYICGGSLLFFVGCITPYVKTDDLADFSQATVDPGGSVTRAGQKVELEKAAVDIHKRLPDVELTDTNWQSFRFGTNGQVRIISIVPSIDTRVCEQQTHLLADTPLINPKIQRITLSRDLPAAQGRFALENAMENVTFVSDYKTGAFGKASGLMMKDSGLLTRAVVVLDQTGQVRYLQIVPEITKLPDLARAVEVANKLIEDKKM